MFLPHIGQLKVYKDDESHSGVVPSDKVFITSGMMETNKKITK
jgi:hypothetical protein